jgi:hypothetical protein
LCTLQPAKLRTQHGSKFRVRVNDHGEAYHNNCSKGVSGDTWTTWLTQSSGAQAMALHGTLFRTLNQGDLGDLACVLCCGLVTACSALNGARSWLAVLKLALITKNVDRFLAGILECHFCIRWHSDCYN